MFCEKRKQVLKAVIGGGDQKTIHPVRAYDKYKSAADIAKRYYSVLEMFSKSNILKELPDIKSNATAYLELLSDSMETIFTYKSDKIEHILNKFPMVTQEDCSEIDSFLDFYISYKENVVENTILKTCSNLSPHAHFLESKSAEFIENAESEFYPIEDLNINFKLLYLDPCANKLDKKLIILVLHKMYCIGKDMYNIMCKPDVDPEIFVRAVESSMAELSKKVSRCDEAFAKILSSTHILRDNFEIYYKDFVETKNDGIIIEKFMADVSKSVMNNPNLARQFKQIKAGILKLLETTHIDQNGRDAIRTLMSGGITDSEDGDDDI